MDEGKEAVCGGRLFQTSKMLTKPAEYKLPTAVFTYYGALEMLNTEFLAILSQPFCSISQFS